MNMSTPVTPNPGESMAAAIERTAPERAAAQREQLQQLSGKTPDPNAGRIGGLPLTSRPGNVPQPVEKAAAPPAPPPTPPAAPAAAAPIPGAAPGGRVGDPRHQQGMAASIRAAIDPESERILEAKYAAMTPEQRDKSHVAHQADLVRLREGYRIVDNKWVAPAAAARDPATGQFTAPAAPEDVSGLAPWAQAPGLTAAQKAIVITGSEAEMERLYESGTPEQMAHWDALVDKQEAKERADGWVAAGQLTVDDLHGYTLPAFVRTNLIKRDEMATNLKNARAAGFTQDQVNAFMRAELANKT